MRILARRQGRAIFVGGGYPSISPRELPDNAILGIPVLETEQGFLLEFGWCFDEMDRFTVLAKVEAETNGKLHLNGTYQIAGL